MNLLKLLFFSLVLISISSFTADNLLQPRWAVVGAKSINFKQDKETIPLKLADVPFTTIRLGFDGEKINMHHIVIHFENKEVQTVPMKKIFKSGSMSRIIDLNGGKRKISRLVIYYRPNHLTKQNATVELWAKIDTENNQDEN